MSKLKTVSYMLEEETEEWIKEQAAAQERSASWLIRAIIADYRDRLKQRQQSPSSPRQLHPGQRL